MIDEARQTSLHDHNFWNEHSRLRSNPVSFISAGQSEPLKDTPLIEQCDDSSDQPPASKELWQSQNERDGDRLESDMKTGQAHDCIGEDDEPKPFFFDTVGEKTTDQARQAQVSVPVSPSSPSSSSSEEVILFRGRNPGKLKELKANELRQAKEDKQLTNTQRRAQSPNYDYISTSKHSSRKPRPQRKKDSQPSDDDMVADYINNMRDNGELDCLIHQTGHNQRELGATDTEVVLCCSESDDHRCRNRNARPKTRKMLAHHSRNSPGTIPDPSTQTELQDHDQSVDNIGEDTLVKLIAAQDLSSGSAAGADTQTSESDYSDGCPPRRNTGMQDDFDSMDWSKASIRPKRGKGYRSQVSFDHCDSDLELQLQVAWKNNRLKKKERKRQREELRALGMLRKNATSDDLRAKYPSGISVEQVAEEFRSFLQAKDEV